MSTGAHFDDLHAPADGNTATMSNRLPYNFDNQYTAHPSSHSHSAAHSTVTDPFSSILSPSQPPHHAMTVAEWAGIAVDTDQSCKDLPESVQQETGDWRDVHRNIKRMDQLYDATFYSWLKSEDNVLVTAMYLHRIANEYSLDRVANALKWLVADWRWESTSILVRHVTVDWLDHTGDLKRAYLLRHLTQNWATQYTATLITAILATPPYVTAENAQRERFLRAFTQDWDFSKLSEFFMYLQSRANIDYKLKCIMLQEAARHEREALTAKLSRRKKRSNRQDSGNWLGAEASSSSSSSDVLLDDQKTCSSDSNGTTALAGSSSSNSNVTSCSRDSVAMESIPSASTVIGHSSPVASSDSSLSATDKTGEEAMSSNLTWRRHHRRTSSNDAADMNKRYRMTRPDLEAGESESSNAALPSCSASVGCISNAASPSSSTTTTAANPGTSSSASSANNRRATTPDHALHHLHHHHHHHHHHHLRYPTSSTATTASGTSSTAVVGSSSDGGATGSNSNVGSSNVPSVSAGILVENCDDSNGGGGGSNGIVTTTSASAISSEFSHLHLGSNNTVASSSSTSSTPSPPVVDVFSTPRHHSCYQTTTSTSSSHLQVHNLRRLRRRSSSSSSSTSTASAASSHQIEDESNVKKRNSERKDSLFCG
ncbi:hypothetical protein VTP01DRAFT_10639, partial [Rhizomucor pusillus]|uniref:uncharacterized protein n=1 Tax=Rhizomucor pusillus TaxID=4840 RepID=UPI0037439FA5